LGGSAPPIPNCFGLFSNRGFVTTCTKPNAINSVHTQTHSNHGTTHNWSKKMDERGTYLFLLGRHWRLTTSLRGLQICGSNS
jgi:hypothetical protein